MHYTRPIALVLFILFMAFLPACKTVLIESPKEFLGTPVSVTLLPKTYREIGYAIKDESYYIDSSERLKRFFDCLDLHVRGGSSLLASQDMDTVNKILGICLPEDVKIYYKSPKWYETHLGPSKDFQFSKGVTGKIHLPHKAIAEINAGYIRWKDVDSFGFSDMAEILEKFERGGKDTVIVDLEDNTGGRLGNMEEFLKLVLPGRSAPYFTYERSWGRAGPFFVRESGKFFHFNFVFLVNKKTASAAEVIVEVLRREGAVVVGENTFGKGTVQETTDFLFIGKDYRGILTLTTRKIIYPDNTSHDKIGIQLDVHVEPSEDALEKAIEVLGQGGRSNGF